MQKTKLEMEFLDKASKKFVITLEEPRSDLNPLEVSQAMETILTHNIFQSSAGDLESIKDARLVTTTVSKLEI